MAQELARGEAGRKRRGERDECSRGQRTRGYGTDKQHVGGDGRLGGHDHATMKPAGYGLLTGVKADRRCGFKVGMS
jgi:hypothetical protein